MLLHLRGNTKESPAINSQCEDDPVKQEELLKRMEEYRSTRTKNLLTVDDLELAEKELAHFIQKM